MINWQKDGGGVIQPGDKNAGAVLMNRADYIAEGERQLYDTYEDADGNTQKYYEKVDPKEIKNQYNEVKDALDEGLQKGFIDLNTECLSWFCDTQLKDDVKNLDSYLEDTPDTLRMINEINENENLPPNTIPITIDIKSMYTNIPLQEGLDACKETLEKRSDKSIRTEYIMKLLRLVMEKNIFTFNEETWLQLLGTCMGTRVSPTYACLFMGLLEKKMLDNCPAHLKDFLFKWKRFIDDCLIFWTGTWEQFIEFHTYLNGVHPTIKFDEPCYNPEDNSCTFLDLKIFVENNKIRTDLHRKDTDKPRALLPSSAHPNHITSNIVYSMCFRLMRICDSEDLFEKRAAELKKDFLMPIGYKSRLIEAQYDCVRNLPGENYVEKRKLALEKKVRLKQSDRVIGVFDFNPVLPNIGGVLKKHWRTKVSDNPDLKEPFPEPPMAALRQGPNLRRILCKSKLSKKARNPGRATHRSAAGWKRCSSSGKKQCPICPYTPMSAVAVTSQVTDYTHHITTPITCETENVVYIWSCKKCRYNCEIHTNKRNVLNFRPATNVKNNQKATNYIGRTKRKFKIRMSEHRDYPKNGKVEEPSGEHFRLLDLVVVLFKRSHMI